ncbi:MAG: hypothetical protein ACF8NJ_08080 [Phycisphaerales bacterium JB038]
MNAAHASLRFLPFLASLLWLLLLGGCADPAPDVLTFDGVHYPVVRTEVVRAMRAEGFTVDRNDPRLGVFTSKPLAASTLLELFKSDNSNLTQAWESTVNQQRRRVRVVVEAAAAGDAVDPEVAATMTQVTPNPPPPTFESPEGLLNLRVMVFIDRAAQPHWRVETTTRRLSDRAMEPRLEQRGMQPVYWQPISRDPLMEERLMRRIIQGIAAAQREATDQA